MIWLGVGFAVWCFLVTALLVWNAGAHRKRTPRVDLDAEWERYDHER